MLWTVIFPDMAFISSQTMASPSPFPLPECAESHLYKRLKIKGSSFLGIGAPLFETEINILFSSLLITISTKEHFPCFMALVKRLLRSEERRVGKEC